MASTPTILTASEVLERVGSENLAQLLDVGIPRVLTADILKTAIEGGDLSGFTQQEQDAATLGLSRLNERLLDAESEVNSAVHPHYGLPTGQPLRQLKTWVEPLVVFYLHPPQLRPERLVEEVAHVRKRITQLAKDGIYLGQPSDEVPVATIGGAQVAASARLFTASTLKGFM